MPKLLVGLCGPNGSGKSTTYKALVNQGRLVGLPWVNADALLVELRSERRKPLADLGLAGISATKFNEVLENHTLADRIRADGHDLHVVAIEGPTEIIVDEQVSEYEAALIAAVIRELLVSEGESFAFETVMSHPSKIDLFKSASAVGYVAQMIFVCTDDVELNVERVAGRVRQGGHPVAVDKIRSRYASALKLLPEAMEACSIVILVDTSGDGWRIVAEKNRGEWKVYDDVPDWARSALPEGLLEGRP